MLTADGRLFYRVGKLGLEAPADVQFAFIGRTGWIGVRCPCGFFASGRSLEALQAGITEHQESPSCPAFEQERTQELIEV